MPLKTANNLSKKILHRLGENDCPLIPCFSSSTPNQTRSRNAESSFKPSWWRISANFDFQWAVKNRIDSPSKVKIDLYRIKEILFQCVILLLLFLVFYLLSKKTVSMKLYWLWLLLFLSFIRKSNFPGACYFRASIKDGFSEQFWLCPCSMKLKGCKIVTIFDVKVE